MIAKTSATLVSQNSNLSRRMKWLSPICIIPVLSRFDSFDPRAIASKLVLRARKENMRDVGHCAGCEIGECTNVGGGYASVVRVACKGMTTNC